MKNRSHFYKIFIGLVIILNSCTNHIEFNETINKNLTQWIIEEYADTTNANELYEKVVYKIKDNKIIKRTTEFIVPNQINETNFIYENELLKSEVKKINYSLLYETTYTYNSNNELIEKLLVRYYAKAISEYKKTLYSHSDNFVDITVLESSNGIDYEPSNYLTSGRLNFDGNDNLIQSELFYIEGFGMQDYFKVTDFTYDKDFNLITKSPSSFESSTYSNIKNPVELLYSSTYGKKNFQLLYFLQLYPLLGSSISKNVLETFKRGTLNHEIINDLNLNGMLSKHTIFESYNTLDLVYKTTHEFIYE